MNNDLENIEILACSYCGSEDVWSRAIYLYKMNNTDKVEMGFKNFDHECDLESYFCSKCDRIYKSEALIDSKFFKEWR